MGHDALRDIGDNDLIKMQVRLARGHIRTEFIALYVADDIIHRSDQDIAILAVISEEVHGFVHQELCDPLARDVVLT